MRLLLICGALAAGEFLASYGPNYAELWPMVAVAGLLVGLVGFGFSVRGWHLLVVFLFGIALFLQASVAEEQACRGKPWLRERRQYERMTRKSQREARWIRTTKNGLARRINLGLAHDPDVADLNRAILLGERASLPAATKRAFVESGTMHVFAISGLHVMAVAQVLMLLTAFLFVPRRWSGVFAMPLLWAYVVVIGMSPSAVRAAMMASFYYLAPVFWRKPDGLRAWTLTFLIVHVSNPLMIESVGSALSFIVMLAIVLADAFGRNLGGVRKVLLMTVAAWAAGVPIAAHVFGRVTPGGMLANLVLIPTAVCSVKSGVIGIVVSFIWEKAAEHINNLCALFTRSMVIIADAVSRLPGADIEVGSWSLTVCLGWYVSMILVVYLVCLIRRRKVFG